MTDTLGALAGAGPGGGLIVMMREGAIAVSGFEAARGSGGGEVSGRDTSSSGMRNDIFGRARFAVTESYAEPAAGAG